MSFASLGVGVLMVYVGVLLVVTEVARRARRDLSPADHFLAGRELGVFVLFLTLYATAYSGNSLLSYPGEAYRRGFPWVMSVGFMMSIIVAFHLLAPRLRPIAVRHGFVTPGDWVRHRFSDQPGARALVIGVALLMSMVLANFLLAQLKAMGELANQVTGGLVSYEIGAIGLALLILFYETRGGMRAVAWTDAAQGVLMLVGLGALLVWVLGASGGLASLTQQIALARPDAVRVPDAAGCANWISTVLLLGLASVVYPQAIQRIYAAKSGATLKRSFAIMTFMPLTTTAVVMLIGLAAIPRFADLGASEADRVMPLLLGQWAEVGSLTALAAVVVFMGALAAIMSTADSVLLSLGSVVAEDLLGGARDDPRTTRRGKAIAAGILLGMVALAMDRDSTLWDLIELKMQLLIQCIPAFVLAIHWSGLRARSTLGGLAVGTVLAVGAWLLDEKRLAGFHTGLLSMGVNLAIAAAGSAWEAQRERGPLESAPA